MDAPESTGPLMLARRRPTVLIADDHALVAEGFASFLSRYYDVLGCIGDLGELKRRLHIRAPDVLLLDISFRTESALTLVPTLHSGYPGMAIVMVTFYDEPTIVDFAMRSGASGYVLKRSDPSELRIAIDEAVSGRTYITPALKATGLGRAKNYEGGGLSTLTEKNRAVLAELRTGLTSRQIASRLGISRKTVDYHVDVMCQQLGIRRRSQLIRWAEQYLNPSGEEQSDRKN